MDVSSDGSPLPFVSVCLLTYKRPGVLPRTLDLLLAQSYPNFELIINDDCSPDETAEIGRTYERRDPRVRYFHNEKNLKYAGNQNAAIERAKAGYVAIVHDGDVYRQDALEKWVGALLAHPTAVIAFSAMDGIDQDGRVVAHHRHPFPPFIRGWELLDAMLRDTGSPIYGIVMVRRSAVLAAGPFDTRLPTLADVDMWMRLLLRGDAAYINEPIVGIYPREKDHHNQVENWRVMREQELIYRLNIARRHERPTTDAMVAWRAAERALWKSRRGRLLSCLKHVKIRALVEGLQMCKQRPIPYPWGHA